MASSQDAIAQSELIGGPTVPIFAAIVYGGYRLFRVGLNSPLAGFPGVLVMWGLISLVCVVSYVGTALGGPGRSWGKAASALSLLVPYAYALAMIGGLGLWDGWQALRHHLRLLHLLMPVVWFFAGWRVLHTLARIQHVSRERLG